MQGKPTKREMKIALEKSIRHWERMANGKRINLKSNNGGIETVTSRSCACCNSVRDSCNAVYCDLCAIGAYNVENRYGYGYGCNNVEYRNAAYAARTHGYESFTFKQAAKIQVAFLKSVLKFHENS